MRTWGAFSDGPWGVVVWSSCCVPGKPRAVSQPQPGSRHQGSRKEGAQAESFWQGYVATTRWNPQTPQEGLGTAACCVSLTSISTLEALGDLEQAEVAPVLANELYSFMLNTVAKGESEKLVCFSPRISTLTLLSAAVIDHDVALGLMQTFTPKLMLLREWTRSPIMKT